MRRIKWLFPLVALTFCALLHMAGTMHPSPAVIQANLLEAFRATSGPLEDPSRMPSALQPITAVGGEGQLSLNFPHVGNGCVAIADQYFQTSLILVNTTDRSTNVTVEFFDDSGSPLEMPLDGVTASCFEFEMAGTELRRLVTSGEGDLVSGWAVVHSEQPLIGTATFGVRDEQGTVLADVGVAPSMSGKSFTVFADSMSWANTGIAISNPSTSKTISVQLELRNQDGSLAETETLNLVPQGHLARFMTELFDQVEGIQEFEGSILLESNEEFSGVTLRTWGSLLTSMPMVPPVDQNSAWTKLAFPHVGDGRANGLKIGTSVILFNNSEQTITGTVHFLRSDTDPMMVTIDGTQSATFGFSLEPGAVARMATRPGPELQTGWAEVQADGPVLGTVPYWGRVSMRSQIRSCFPKLALKQPVSISDLT